MAANHSGTPPAVLVTAGAWQVAGPGGSTHDEVELGGGDEWQCG